MRLIFGFIACHEIYHILCIEYFIEFMLSFPSRPFSMNGKSDSIDAIDIKVRRSNDSNRRVFDI